VSETPSGLLEPIWATRRVEITNRTLAMIALDSDGIQLPLFVQIDSIGGFFDEGPALFLSSP
jgi:hypothetical protein